MVIFYLVLLTDAHVGTNTVAHSSQQGKQQQMILCCSFVCLFVHLSPPQLSAVIYAHSTNAVSTDTISICVFFCLAKVFFTNKFIVNKVFIFENEYRKISKKSEQWERYFKLDFYQFLLGFECRQYVLFRSTYQPLFEVSLVEFKANLNLKTLTILFLMGRTTRKCEAYVLSTDHGLYQEQYVLFSHAS